jgi:hypothetical protein
MRVCIHIQCTPQKECTQLRRGVGGTVWERRQTIPCGYGLVIALIVFPIHEIEVGVQQQSHYNDQQLCYVLTLHWRQDGQLSSLDLPFTDLTRKPRRSPVSV